MLLWQTNLLRKIGVNNMRELLSKIWYYGTLPIYWFFAFVTSEILTGIFGTGTIIGAVMFLLTWRTTLFWVQFTFLCLFCTIALWLGGIAYGFIGKYVVRGIRAVQGVIDGVDYSKYDN